MPQEPEGLDWDNYFNQDKPSFFKNLLSLHRKIILTRALKYYADVYFPARGIFAELGSGTSESSTRVVSNDRKVVALDYNYYVLAKRNLLKDKVQGNVLALPFRSSSIDGAFNLGVMEHLSEEEIGAALKEAVRVMKAGARLLLFWPASFSLHEVILNSIASFLKIFLRKEVRFFPDEINLYRNRKWILGLIENTGLRLKKTHFNTRDLFSYQVIVLVK